MIEFICPKCGRGHTAREKHAGRRGFCSCGAVLVIPSTEAAVGKASLVGELDFTSAIRKRRRLVVTTTLVAVALLGVIIYFVFFQNAWERENRDRLISLRREAEAFVQKAQPLAAEAKFAALFDLLGDRTVIDKALKAEIESARFARDENGKHVNSIRAAQAKATEVRASTDAASDRALLRRIDDLENEALRRIKSGKTDISDIQQELDAVASTVRRRVDAVNRRPNQEGYSIEVRREAAYRTLVQNGTDPSEARKQVEAMEEMGLLPDPPRR